MASAPIGEARVDIIGVTDKLNAALDKSEVRVDRFDKHMERKVGKSSAAAQLEITKLNTRIAQLETQLTQSTTKMMAFERQMLQIDTAAQRGSRNMTALGSSVRTMVAAFGTTAVLAGAAALGAGISKVVSNIVQLKDQAEALGISTKALQEYRYAAQALGVDQEKMEAGLESLNEKLRQASLGAEKPGKIFKTLGIDIRDTEGKVRDAAEVFPELADRLQMIEDPMQRAAVAALVLGDNAADMKKLLDEGGSGIDNLRDAAHRLGVVLSDEQIANADKTAQKLRDVQTVLSADISSFVANNADAIIGLARAFAEAASGALQLINAVRNFNNVRVTNSVIASGAQKAAAERALAGTASGRAALRADVQGKRSDAEVQLADLRSRQSDSPRRQAAAAMRERQIASYNRTLAALDRMDKAGSAARTKPPATTGTIDVSGLLAPKPPRPRTPRKGPADRTDQNEHAFQQALERERMESLRLQQELTNSLDEQHSLEIEMIDLKEKSRAEDIAYMRKRGQINETQEIELNLANKENSDKERELAQRQLRDAKLAEGVAVEEASIELSKEIAQGKMDAARTSEESLDLALKMIDLDFKLQQLKIDEVKASTSATDAEIAIAEEREKMLGLLKKQAIDAARRANMSPVERFIYDRPRTDKERAEALEKVQVDYWNDLNARTAAFADSIAQSFATLGAAIVGLQDPVDAAINFLSSLAATFTEAFIEKPIFDFVRRRSGLMAEDMIGGKAGPYGLDQAAINAAFTAGGTAVGNFATAVNLATARIEALQTGAIDPLSATIGETQQQFSSVNPQVDQFGSGLISVLSSLASGGGGGGILGTVLRVAGAVAGSITTGGGGGLPLGAGGNVYGVSSSLGDVGIYAGGGWIGGIGTGTSDSNTIRASRGEFMVREREASRNPKLLEAINEGRLPHYFATIIAGSRLSAPRGPTINMGGIHMTPTGNESYDRRTIRQLRREIASGVGDALRVGYK